LINIDGEGSTQVFEFIEKKTFIFDKRFNNGITSKLASYKILVMSSLRLVCFIVNLPFAVLVWALSVIQRRELQHSKHPTLLTKFNFDANVIICTRS
jgi:hypothetical protein